MSSANIVDPVSSRLEELIELRRAKSGVYAGVDLYTQLARLRSEAAVHASPLYELLGVPDPATHPRLPGRTHFTALSWEAVNEVYRDNDTFSSAIHAESTRSIFGGRSILDMGGQEHRRYRALVQPAFTRAIMEQWERRWISPLLDRLIAGIRGQGRADLESAICAVLPVSTITAGFGVPAVDAPQFHVWSSEMLAPVGPRVDPLAASQAIGDYLRPLIAERRREETDDVLGLLANATFEDPDGRVHTLDDEEILGFARLMLPAGAGTTWRQMGIILAALLSAPPLLDRVRSDRSLLRNVIEESLRWEANLISFPRLVTRDVILGGMELPAGSAVDAVIAGANRDPARWQAPDVFDIDRPMQQHLGFGNGPHMCIGMHLARTELTAALNRILDGLPGLRLAAGAEPPQVRGVFMRVVLSLPVEFDA